MPSGGESESMLLAPGSETGKLRLLSELTESINLGTSLEEVLGLIFERLHEFIPYNRIAIALRDEKLDRLSIVAARSDGPMVLGRGYSGPIGGSSLEPLLRDPRTRILNDLQEHLRAKPSSESTRLIVREGMRASLTLPLLVQAKPIGAMFFSSRRPGVYRNEHEEFLRGIVGQVAIAVERSRLMDALREKTEFLEQILRNSADAIIVADTEGRIISWNEGARRIFGYADSEIVGRHFSQLLPPELRESGELRRIQEQVERQGFLKDYETERLTKDGRRITINLTTTLLRDRAGRAIGRSAILRDVTTLKKLHEDLVKSRSLAAVGELAATVAHEIKNPLAGISGAIQVLEDAIPASDARRAVVTEILEQIRRLDSTVRDLLTFARPATPVRGDLDLGEEISRAWSLLASQPGATDVQFDKEGADGVRVSVDAHLFQLVWINLFQNAVEAMPKGGRLRVRVEDGPAIRIEVADSGPGVPPENAPKLFRPFFSTKTRGTGLGLAISRKIVEAHGGTIRIESEPGRGTRVLVEVPR